MPKGQRISEETKQEVVRMTLEKHTQTSIADRLGLSVSTIGRIQREMHVEPIRNGYCRHYEPDFSFNKPEKTEEEEAMANEPEGVILADKTVKMVGSATGFMYTASLKGKDLTIETNYGEPFIIDIKDLTKLANELISVAQKVEEMRHNVFRV